ncbi:MAG: efflux RND transporter periplasmic adaptor subunit [Ancalomicrobiaceae bacterium]|nr:efflux RND transporter periplasmic adaptor subunit [Ancalomicrobiaceae bacterium]
MNFRPTKSDFRKINGRYQSSVETPVGSAEAGAGDGQSAEAQKRRRRGGFLLPLIVLVAIAAYLDKTGSLPFWPVGMLAQRLVPLLPAPIRVAVESWTAPATPTQNAAEEPPGPGPGGPGGSRRVRPGGNQAVPVLVAKVKTEDVPVTTDAVGTVQALATILVKPQIDGLLLEVGFKEGQFVKKGDVLARLDARTYQAQYDQMVAKKAQDESQLANAMTDLARYEKLATTDYGTRQQADTQKAMVTQLQALVRADQAQIDNARTYLDYTTVRAPIDGRTGIRVVDPGNIVHANDQAGIVVLTEVQPISIIFNLPQQSLKALSAATARGPVDIQVLDADEANVIDRGTLTVIDNQVDPTTGTVRLKATFPNTQSQLWPGQFVNVRVLVETLKDAVVVPSAAVQRGPNGAYVFVVAEDKTARQTPVVIGRQDELRAVVVDGVKPPAEVVTTGFARLIDGTKVTIGTADTSPDATPTKRPDDKRRKAPGQPDTQPTPESQDAPANLPDDAQRRRSAPGQLGPSRRGDATGPAGLGRTSPSQPPDAANTQGILPTTRVR